MMKRNIAYVLIAFLVFLLCCSCTSLSLEMKAQNEGVPEWVYVPQKQSGRVFFVGKGTDKDSYRASLKASIDISSQLAEYLGAPLSDDQYRELTTLRTIRDYSLSVQSKAEKTNSDGTVTIYLLAAASENKLHQLRSSTAEEKDQLLLDVQKKQDEAQAFYQKDMDIEAVKTYLDAARLAYTNQIETISSDALVDKACSILQRTQMKIIDSDPSMCRCTVSVQRRNRFFASAIDKATVRASVDAKGASGTLYRDSFVFASGKDGKFEFISPNDGILKQSSVLFQIDLGTSLEEFTKAMPLETSQRVTSILEEKTAVLDYSLTSPFAGTQIVLSVIEMDLTGDVTSPSDEPSDTSKNLGTLLEDSGIAVSLLGTDAADDDAAFQQALESAYPFYGYLIDARVGVENSYQSGTVTSVLANGSVKIYKRGESSPVFDSGTVQSAASNKDADAAVKEAFELYGNTICYRIRDWFFFF